MADINGGPIELEVLISTGQLDKGLEESKKKVRDFTEAAKMGGETMDAAYQSAKDTIDTAWKDIDKMTRSLDDSAAKLKTTYDNLGSSAAAAFNKGTAAGDKEYIALSQRQAETKKAQQEVEKTRQEVAKVADELIREEQALDDIAGKVQSSAEAHASLRTQYRQIVQQLAEMEQAGQRGTEEFARLQKEAGRLNDALGDAAQQAKILGHDNGGLQGVIQAASGAAGAITAVNGAMSLFGAENENIQKSLLKVQSLMSITMGLQQAATALNKDSYFRIILLGKAQQTYAATVDRTNAALVRMGVSATAANVASKALVATLTLGIGVAITAIVTAISKVSSRMKEVKEEAKKMNSAIADAAAKPVSTIRELSNQWEKLGDDMQAKERFIDENKDKFKELGVAIDGTAGAEKLLIENKKAFIKAQLEKAKAIAAQSLAQEKAKKLIEEQLKLESMPEKKTRTVMTYGSLNGAAQLSTYETDNKAREKQQAIVDNLDKELKDLYTQAADYQQKGQKILEDAGINIIKESGSALEGSIRAQQQVIKDLQEKYELTTTDAERRQLKIRIDAEQKKLDAMTEAGKQETDTYKQQLDERRNLYEQYQRWVNSTDDVARQSAKDEFAALLEEGENYLEYLTRQRDSLLQIPASKMSAAQREQLSTLTDEITKETDRTVAQKFEKALEQQMADASGVLEMLDIIRQKREELASMDVSATDGRTRILDAAQAEAEEQARQETEALLQSYTSYLARKLQFDAEYAGNRALLERRISDETASEAERDAARAALAALEAQREIYEQDGGDEEYRQLLDSFRTFAEQRKEIEDRYRKLRLKAEQKGNAQLVAELAKAEQQELSSLTAQAFDKEKIQGMTDVTIDSINGLIVELDRLHAQGEISDDDMRNLVNRLQDMKRELVGTDLFAQLFNADSLDQARAAASGIAANLMTASDAMEAIARSTGNVRLAETFEIASDIVGNFQAAEKGAEAWGGWWGAIIGGVTDLIPKIIKWSDRDTDRSLQRHAQNVADLQQKYDELSWHIGKAFGTAKYTETAKLIQNLKQQQDELNRAADDEAAKKNSDASKVQEYRSQAAAAAREIQDTVEQMRDDLLGTDISSMADSLGQAIIAAFGQGEDAARAWGDEVNKIVKGIVQNLLVQNLLTSQVQGIVDRYTSRWVNANGTFMGWETVFSSIDGLYADLEKFGNEAIPAMQKILERFPEMFQEDSTQAGTLSGAYKTASQESIDLLAGQTNVQRVVIEQGTEYLRQQLLHIAAMDSNVASISSLVRQINDKLGDTGASLRAQGITTT